MATRYAFVGGWLIRRSFERIYNTPDCFFPRKGVKVKPCSRMQMGHFFIRMMWVTVLWLFIGGSESVGAADVDMKIVNAPDHISRFSEFYVRVKITNNDKEPLRGCHKSESKCAAVGWQFVPSPSVMTLPARDNISPIQAYVDDLLPPEGAIEKTIRIIPTTSLPTDHAIVSLSLLVKAGPTMTFTEQQITLPVKPPPKAILIRRILIRALVYTYLGISIALLALWLIRTRSSSA